MTPMIHGYQQRPYYIYAPDYRRTSTGIAVLHMLCHALNVTGNEAYVTTGQVNPKWWTPVLNDELRKRHVDEGREPIVIYPEVTHGNPLGGKTVIRYLLNHVGLLGGPGNYADTDFLVAYTRHIQNLTGATECLFLPPTDTTLFNNLNNPDDANRAGFLIYPGRHRQALEERPDLVDQCTLITASWPSNHSELAALLRKSKRLYVFEPSNLSLEAVLCGCPVVLLKSPYFDGTPLATEELGTGGLSIGEDPDSIARAEATLPEMSKNLAARQAEFWANLAKFVQTTQTLPAQTATDAGTPHPESSREYEAWKARKSLQEIDGQILAERMHKWAHPPQFNIVVDVLQGEADLLADTLDSLAIQWYPNWHLTIIAEFPPTSPELAEIPQISWVQCEPETHAQALNEVLPQLPGNWLYFVEPGCRLEPHALVYFGDTINLYPQARLIYADEDQQLGLDQTTQPRFKPDFNLELLRGTYYLGTGLMVQRQAYEHIGGLCHRGMAGLLDITFKLAETLPARNLIHLPEILLHTPEIGLRTLSPDAEQVVVREHFARQGINGQVADGLLNGTQSVIYAVEGTPLVSIVIPTHDQPGYLTHCIESLLAETTYPHFELILVDHQTTDPDALAYLTELQSRPALAGRLTLLRNDAPFSYAALCNQGAAAAQGEFLLFLDNDTEFIQAEWLERLIGHIQQRGVVAVSPRLSCPDGNLSILNQGPRILGLRPLAGPAAGNQANIVEPGYYGNLQVAQEVSALSGSCLMVRSAQFHQHSGFDADNTPVHEAVLDLCLRFRAAELKLIWTPWADVVHRDRATRKRLATDPKRARDIELSLEAESEFVLKQYLDVLANDPYYHRQLSLQDPYAIEPHAVIDWDTRFHDRLRVLGSPLSGGSGEYRMLAPFRALQKAGLAQCCQIHPIGKNVQRILNPIELARAAPDTLMVQQAIEDASISQMKRFRQFNRNVFMTYAVDDVIGNLPKKHYLYNFQIREGKSRLREGLALCDRLIASTEPIADFCRGMVDDIVVVPNCLEGERWLQHTSKRRVSEKPRVGWAGAQQHLGDLELIKEVVEATHREVDWIFMGMCPDFLKPFVKEEHGFVPFADYPAKLASLNLDLAIAPLEQLIFNEGKSNLRLLEYGLMGWPVVCTDVYPYRTNHAPVKRVQNNVTEWVEAIRERVNDLDAAAKEGDQLREWVLKHYILENNLDRWLAAVTPR